MQGSKNKKRILVVTSTFPRWHDDVTPPFVFELCKRLLNKGSDIDVLTPHANNAKKNESINGIDIFRYSYFINGYESLSYDGGILANLKKNKLNYLLVPLFLIAQTVAIVKRLSEKQYDLIHAHWTIPQGLLCVLICKYVVKKSPKILCTSHGSDLFALRSGIMSALRKWTVRHVDALTVVSEHMHAGYSSGNDIDNNKIHVCPMGVDLKERFISQKDIHREKYRLIFVGRLIEKKGINHLLDAINELSNKFDEINLLLVGDGPDRYILEDKCKALNIDRYVKFYGPATQRELPRLYSSASIAVMPSIDQEGLGLVAIEAMGCGCAVIASSLPALEEIIENDVNGVLVKPGNTAELVAAIENLLVNTDIKDDIVAKARDSVVNRFDWHIAADKYKEIIYSICNP